MYWCGDIFSRGFQFLAGVGGPGHTYYDLQVDGVGSLLLALKRGVMVWFRGALGGGVSLFYRLGLSGDYERERERSSSSQKKSLLSILKKTDTTGRCQDTDPSNESNQGYSRQKLLPKSLTHQTECISSPQYSCCRQKHPGASFSARPFHRLPSTSGRRGARCGSSSASRP